MLLGEGLAIVLSILLAFAIDAWWGERAERAEEQEVLQSLVAEFEANRAEAALVISIHERQIQLIAKLMGLSEQQILDLPQDEVSAIIAAMANPWGFDSIRGSTDALIGAGKLGILQDRELREALTTFIGMDEATVYDREIVLYRSNVVWDLMIRDGGPWRAPNAGLSAMECSSRQTSVNGPCNNDDPLVYMPEANPADLLRLSKNPVLMGAAHQNKAASRMYVAGVQEIANQIDRILVLLGE